MSANPFLAKTIALLRWIALLQGALVLVSLAIVMKSRKLESSSRQVAFFWTATVFSCLFLMSKLSAWVWEFVPGLPQIQFSTRWMSILTLASSLVIGLAMGANPKGSSRQSKWLRLGHFSLCVIACFFSVIIVLSGCFLGEEEENLAAANVCNAPEYNPKPMPNWRQRAIQTRDPLYAVIQGTAQVSADRWQAQLRHLYVEAEEPARLRLRLFNYPGWVVTANNDRLNPTVDPSTGGMVIDLAPGANDLRIEFTDTWWRRIASLVSLLTVLTLIARWVQCYFSSKEISNPISTKSNLKNKRSD